MAGEENQPITKAELRVELSALDSKLTGQMVELEDKLTGQIVALEDKLTGQIFALEDRMVEKMRGIETNLLTEFRKWALPVNYRLSSLETHNERLALVEERLTNLERKER